MQQRFSDSQMGGGTYWQKLRESFDDSERNRK